MNADLSPKDIVDAGMCIGCGSCVAQSGVPQVKMDFDNFGHLKPYGPDDWYEKPSSQIVNTCPFSPAAVNEDELARELFPDPAQKNISAGHFQNAYVGYVNQAELRAKGSSGGMTTWVATELLRNDLIDAVVHVVPSESPDEDGSFFHFSISRTVEQILQGAKSRYYPTELSNVLAVIRKEPGRYAVVGVPCFIKAIQLLRRQDEIFRDRIKFTLGLFCGHMKSSRLVESFAVQMNVKLSAVAKVEFRHKFPDRAAYWYNARMTLKDGSVASKDWRYMNDGDWGAGFFMNSACNYCDDVIAETADVSFGDAWVEPYALDGLGTNVVVVRSAVVGQLISKGIDSGRLALTEVNGAFIARTQEAGLRQRREGLAYRLSWNNTKIKPKKRVAPDSKTALPARKLIYLMRYHTSIWSNRIFCFSRRLNLMFLYLFWARIILWTYHKVNSSGAKVISLLNYLSALFLTILINSGILILLKLLNRNEFFDNLKSTSGIFCLFMVSLGFFSFVIFFVLPEFIRRTNAVLNLLYALLFLVQLFVSFYYLHQISSSLALLMNLFYLAPVILVYKALNKTRPLQV